MVRYTFPNEHFERGYPLYLLTIAAAVLIGALSRNKLGVAVILLSAHAASFAHNFVSGMQSFDFSESQDARVLQTCH